MREPGIAAQDGVAAPWLRERLPTVAWVAVGALLLLQYGLFRQYALREVVWGYPTSFDQAAALRRSYETFEKILDHGLIAGVRDRLAQPAPTGVLMPIEGALLFLLMGPSRLSALTLNFLHLACFQIVLVATLRWLSGRWSIAALGLGLLLCARAPLAVMGGLADFRMDLIALCLWGIFLGLVIRSGVFAHRGFSLAAGCVGGLLVLTRFITLLYVLGCLATVLVFLALRHRRTLLQAPQARGAAAAALVVLAMAAPMMAVNLPSMRAYYGVGHFTGIEREIRIEEQGTITAADYLAYYPRNLARDHAGPLFLAVAGMAILVAGALGTRFVRAPRNGTARDVAATFVFLGSSFLVPLAALTFHVVKQGVVASILVPPLLWLTVFTVVWLTGAVRGRAVSSLAAKGLVALGVTALVAGVYNQLDRLGRQGPLAAHRGDVAQLLSLYDAIGEQSRLLGWPAPRVSTDRLTEFLYPGLVPVVVYERQGHLLQYNGGLGGRIFAVTEQEALQTAEGSDFVVLTDTAPDNSVYPFERSMQALRPKLRRLCEERLARLGEFGFFGRQATLYVRPAVGVEGDSGGWVTTAGLVLRGSGPVLRARPRLLLAGQANFAWLPRVPSVRAVLSSGAHDRDVPATMATSGQDYCIRVDLARDAIAADGSSRIHVAFDAHFVPKQIGLNEDTRQLVIPTPRSIRLVPADGPGCSFASP